MSNEFIASESGAVSVEWIMLAGALTALSVVTIPPVLGALGLIRPQVEDRLSTPGGSTAGLDSGSTVIVQTMVDFDTFSDGTTGWTVTGPTYDDPGLPPDSGMFLMRDDGGMSRTYDIPEGSDYALVEIDLTTLGTFETNDDIIFTINGQTFQLDHLRGGEVVFPSNFDLVTRDIVTADKTLIDQRRATYPGTQTTNSDIKRTQEMRATFVITNPGSSVNLDISIQGNTHVDRVGEGISFDNIRVTAGNNTV